MRITLNIYIERFIKEYREKNEKKHEEQKEVKNMKFNVKKVETVAVTDLVISDGGVPWKEAKAQCL